ncbi:MAG: carbohydrate kinase family protein [Victivallales bacterium]|nr:carbohydrate kinase family protein [Victivallales bacterium]
MTGKVTVAGYLCLDIVPRICAPAPGEQFSYVPGKLQEITGTDMACGGAVANTGMALHILGIPVNLAARLGDDIVGMTIRGIIESYHPALADNFITDATDSTGCTVVLNPPGQDRMFLVNPGANRYFGADDVSDAMLAESRLLHFGYPPLMEKFYRHDGAEALALFRRARRHGAAVSLDMSLPDGNSASARINWRQWLQKVLPEVDIFLPSLEEIRFMLRGDFSGDYAAAGAVAHRELRELSGELLEMGAAVVVIKLGSQGIYVRTTAAAPRLAAVAALAPEQHANWFQRELLCPCFQAEVKGATGAGDCTIAGFLAGMLQQFPLEQTARLACAVGSCNVEQPDAISGLLPLDATLQRLAQGWAMEDDKIDLEVWSQQASGIYQIEK